jgi:hypothetical protein
MTTDTTDIDSLLASRQKAADTTATALCRSPPTLRPDEKREWESLVPRMWGVLTQFLVFGPYPLAPPIPAHELRLARFASQGGRDPPYPRNPSDAHKAPNNPRRSS